MIKESGTNTAARFFHYLEGSKSVTVGLTEHEIIWKKNKTTLSYYKATEKKYRTPIFLIYSLVNRSYILDLGPGYSMIEGFLKEGYDVYLLDFGVPGYEDKDLTLGHYIIDYIQSGVRRALRHSDAKEVSVMGFCLGGTLTVIYAALAAEPVKNLILFVTPIDFSHTPYMKNSFEALKKGDIEVDELIDEYGTIPGKVIENMLRLITGIVSVTPYFALIGRMEDEKYVEKWQRFNKWLKDPVPFAGATMKELVHELLIENRLVQNKMAIRGQAVNLRNIAANLLVVATEGDQLIPVEMIEPLMSKVSSQDKTFKKLKGGHVNLAIRGGIPEFLAQWLRERS